MSSDPESYKRQAEAAYQLGFELLKTSQATQIEYGRWLVNTLWLMHSGAIVGLLFKAHVATTICGRVIGIVSAFVAAFVAWWNFTFPAVLFQSWADVRMLSDPKYWPAPKKVAAMKAPCGSRLPVVSVRWPVSL
ncbi:hypothetical protein [Bradyrhizobium sp. CCBAU 53415]|uniref:hypothetical protein n=1 Tax=Bradyrhizobium sp. CCBAU 53415 TaxID=1325119 RepID=UPI0023055597|nr:hypothetical protein [Bradyrhizobium sp. CCBAU 53415]